MRPSLAAVILLIAPATTLAQMTPPVVVSAKPMGLVPGQVATLEIRGQFLDGASAVLFDGLDAKIESLEPAKDVLKVKIRIPETAAPGLRSFRVVTPKGLSNTGRIVVTRPIPLIAEKEPNNGFRSAQSVKIPCTVEGTLKNGEEVDVYAVDMRNGQTLVVEAFAARGGSGLDPLVTIFSPEGREMAADDDLFGRDAAAWLVVPKTGRYFVQIQDANGRNPDGPAEAKTTREYLLVIGEVPLVVSAYPPGARRGQLTRFDLLGVNIPDGLAFQTSFPPGDPLGDALLRVEAPKGVANSVTIRLGDGPELVEPDPEGGDDPLRPMPAVIPGAISGRFSALDGGDIDYYRLVPPPGLEGDYAITVYAAKIGSPADPVVSIVDPRGASQAEDDDKLGRDARIERRIDGEGITIAVREAFGRGGPRFVYRIEVEPIARAGMKATIDLGGRTIPRGGSIALPVTLDRQGDDGPATVLAGELPPGVTAAPMTIPAKGKGGFLVLTAASDAPLGVFPFRLVARDTKRPVEVAYRERGERRGPPRPNDAKDGPGVAVDRPMLAIAEPASIGLAIAPEEIVIAPAGTAEIKVTIDRRTDAAKGPVNLRLLTSDGVLDGFDKIDAATVPADKSEHIFTLKLKAGSASRRVPFAVKGWLASGSDVQGVDSRPAALTVP